MDTELLMTCCKCGRPLSSYSITAYGEVRCLDCFDDHLMTDKGKVEYFIGLCTGELDIKDYDADFLGHVSVCWRKYRDELKLTLAEIKLIEATAEGLGIL